MSPRRLLILLLSVCLAVMVGWIIFEIARPKDPILGTWHGLPSSGTLQFKKDGTFSGSKSGHWRRAQETEIPRDSLGRVVIRRREIQKINIASGPTPIQGKELNTLMDHVDPSSKVYRIGDELWVHHDSMLWLTQAENDSGIPVFYQMYAEIPWLRRHWIYFRARFE